MRQPVFWPLCSGIILLLLGICTGTLRAQQIPSARPVPLEEYIAFFEDPERDKWQKPDAVVQALNLKNGQVVADIGAGSGYFTLRLARAVAPKGMVYALDTEEGTLDYLRQRLAKEKIQNVRTLLVPAHNPLLIDGSIDLAFICNIYHHLADRNVYLRKLGRALKPQGRVVIVDFYQEEGMPVGPPMHMRLNAEIVEKELQGAGLEVTQKLTFLPYQYILIARPGAESSVP
jgi:ubiquinone/menaquinone biosynthesis C-methylase UbiE